MSRIPQSELHAAVSGLMRVDPWKGLRITALNVIGMNAFLVLVLSVDSFSAFFGLAVLAGFFYTSAMMTTHDAIHHTLTGWHWFDEIVPRAFGYFIFWPHGLYAELHKLHHKLNGKDLRDPELPTYTADAYERASPLGRFAMRNDWWLSLFVYGGFGMIGWHLREGFKFFRTSREVRRAILGDAIGIAACAGIELAVVFRYGSITRYVIYLLCLERIIGFFHQLRSHVEHYGLFGSHESMVETRLYNCRNVRTKAVVSRFFNGLNFHSVHHAFPGIPFYHLRTAHERIAALCARHGKPLEEGDGYVRTVWRLARQPQLIAAEGAVAPISQKAG